jgi:hypothetical protein
MFSVYAHSQLKAIQIQNELSRVLIHQTGLFPCQCGLCRQKKSAKCTNSQKCNIFEKNKMCGECQNSAKCICFDCMANDMFCFIYIGHGFGKGHGFLHGTDLDVRVFLKTKMLPNYQIHFPEFYFVKKSRFNEL